MARREFIWRKADKLVPTPVILKRLATSCQKTISKGFCDRGISRVLLHQLAQYKSQFLSLEIGVIVGVFCPPFQSGVGTGGETVQSDM